MWVTSAGRTTYSRESHRGWWRRPVKCAEVVFVPLENNILSFFILNTAPKFGCIEDNILRHKSWSFDFLTVSIIVGPRSKSYNAVVAPGSIYSRSSSVLLTFAMYLALCLSQSLYIHIVAVGAARICNISTSCSCLFENIARFNHGISPLAVVCITRDNKPTVGSTRARHVRCWLPPLSCAFRATTFCWP